MKRPKTVRMPVWKGFRAGANDDASTGEIAVDFHGSRITERQLAAVPAAVKQAKTLQPKLLDAILGVYPKLEKHWEKPKPKTMTKAKLKDHFKLWEILISADHHEDVAYVAYQFESSWHPSGAIVLTHRDRIVRAGDFDVLGYPHADPLRTTKPKNAPTPAKVRALRAAAEVRAKKNPKTLVPGEDETIVFLPVWAGFASDGVRPSKGEVMVSVGGDDPSVTVGRPQQAAYEHLLRHAPKVQANLLDAIAAAYPKLSRGAEGPLPKTVDRDALASLVELVSIHVHGAAKNGLAIVGYELACRWDEEHGVGALVAGDRVLDVGGADTAILRWKADKAAKAKRA